MKNLQTNNQTPLSILSALVLLGSVSLYGGTESDAKANVLYGVGAGVSLDGTGYNNVFLGKYSGYSTTGSDNNTFIGNYSGRSNTTGSWNVFTGYDSGYNNTTGYQNVFTGFRSGRANTTGHDNVFNGHHSGYKNTTGSYNVFTGEGSGYNNTTGFDNVFTGYHSGLNNTTGRQNVFIGRGSGYSNTTGLDNVFTGEESGYHNTTGYDNVFTGRRSGYSNISGKYNVFNGLHSGYFNTVGDKNTFNGFLSGYRNTTGSNNTFNGFYSGLSNKTGRYNTFLGVQSGYNAKDINASVLIGYNSGYNANRNNVLYIDNSATNSPLIYGEFDNNMVKINGELNATGAISSVFSGYMNSDLNTLFTISSNNTNTNRKSDAGFVIRNNKVNQNWTFRTLETPDATNTSFAISKQYSGKKEMVITGNNTTGGTVLTLANGAYCDGVWHDASSRSLKENIKPLAVKEALKAFNDLEPMTYVYKNNPTDPKVGFIAEDVPELIADPKRKSISSIDIVALLTKVVQVQGENMKAQEKNMKIQEEKINNLETILSKLTNEKVQ